MESQQENQLSPLPNEILLEILLFFSSSPYELHHITQIINKTFCEVIRQYEQKVYELFCFNATKLYPSITKPCGTNFKLNYLLHCL